MAMRSILKRKSKENFFHAKTYNEFYKKNKDNRDYIETIEINLIEHCQYSKIDFRKLIQYIHQNKHLADYKKKGLKTYSLQFVKLKEFKDICSFLKKHFSSEQFAIIIQIFELTIIESTKSLNELHLLHLLINSSSHSQIKLNKTSLYVGQSYTSKKEVKPKKKGLLESPKQQPKDIKKALLPFKESLMTKMVFLQSLSTFYPEEIRPIEVKYLSEEIDNALSRIEKSVTAYNNIHHNNSKALFYYFLDQFYKKNNLPLARAFHDRTNFILNVSRSFLVNSTELESENDYKGLEEETIRKHIQRGKKIMSNLTEYCDNDQLKERLVTLDTLLK